MPACWRRASSAVRRCGAACRSGATSPNRGLTFAGNLLLGTKVSEFHTGYRAYSRELLERLPLAANSDDFVFDNEVLAETVWLGYSIGEVSCPTRYAPDASSINFRAERAVRLRMPGHGRVVPAGRSGAC